MAEPLISVSLTKRQWLALVVQANLGLKASEAFGLVQNTMSAEQARNAINQAVSGAK